MCCLQVKELVSSDYRRLMLEGPAVQLLQAPVSAAASVSAGSSPPASGGSGAGEHAQRFYFWPQNSAAHAALEQQWARLSADSTAATPAAGAAASAAARTLPVMFGRTLLVERSCNGVAWFAFEELCARPLGAADYIALCAAFHTIFLAGVPLMSMQNRDQARRFITLLDELYNARVRLVVSAAAPPDQLFTAAAEGGEQPLLDLESLQFEGAVEGSRLRRDVLADGGVAPVAADERAALAAAAELGGLEEKFAFQRAVSRLFEMQHPLFGRRSSGAAAALGAGTGGGGAVAAQL